ncbi:hypothetical protein Y032_0885g2853 [Ancylostoma ceylanicum]|uniref:Uncharacterized protein n=1 Tax=Ancylostoma ceylanicum TaxID=53326 RepID=A0A016W9R5_9BILA|nr:hypothetical protein Y032_0885g2853 [Ancylostoma ceylanicum]
MPFKTLPDSEGRTFERANRNVLKRHLDENTWISWDSTVYGIIKKTLELVVLVDAIDGFGQDVYGEAASICSVLDIDAEDYIRNVFKSGESLEIHFMSIYKRDRFLDKFRCLLNDDK